MNDQQNISENKITEIFENAQAYEAKAYEAFSAKFDMQFPMPEKPTVRMMQAIGWQFIVIIIQAFFAVLLASLRTADMFYDAAAGSNSIVQFIEAASAVMAVEFGIVIFATIKSEAKNVVRDMEQLKSVLQINTKLLNTGIGAGVFVSIVAGLGVSFKGFGLDVELFSWVLAIVMGIGASVIAWVSGDILGAILARFGNARTLAELEYRQELEQREAKKQGMFEASPERKIARSQLTEMKELMQANQFRAPRASRATRTPAPAPQPNGARGNNEVRARIYEYLDAIMAAEGRVAGPSELHREQGVAKSYASGVIKDWTAERGVNIPTSETPVEEPSEEVSGEA